MKPIHGIPGRELTADELKDVQNRIIAAEALECDTDYSKTGFAEELYGRLLEQRAQGKDIDPAVGEWVLAECGKSMDDWNADLAKMTALMAQLGW